VNFYFTKKVTCLENMKSFDENQMEDKVIVIILKATVL